MGAATSSLFNRRRSNSVLVLGLDSAGKTTMAYALTSKVEMSIPTIGFNVAQAEVKTQMNVVNMTCWDVGGRDKLRPLWRHFYQNQDAIIFVVDCQDFDRIDEVEREIRQAVQEDMLIGKPLLIYANKQDLPGAMSSQELIEKLGLHGIRDRKWHVQESTMTTKQGLYEGLDWLLSTINGTHDVPSSSLTPEAKAAKEERDDASTADTESAYRDRTFEVEELSV